MEITGPFNLSKGPTLESLRRIFTRGHLDGHHQPSYARKNVTAFERRAYRRPPTVKEVNRVLGLVAQGQKEGDGFDESIAVAIRAVLVSPQFLFRIEKDPKTAAGADHFISQYELASRLSYFLWSSTSDGEFVASGRSAATAPTRGTEAQVHRLLNDPKAQALVENFGGQWLQFRDLESVKPDPNLFPQFDEYLRMSMRRETEMFFENIIRENRPVTEFLNASYSFLNERLANFYKIKGVSGPEFRKVDSTDTHRGGILTHGSVLTVSSYAIRTSVVLRAKYVLENILSAPVRPPIAIPVGISIVHQSSSVIFLTFGFELSLDRRVGLWECGNLAAFARFPRGGWEEWESCFCFSTLSTAPPFPQPSRIHPHHPFFSPHSPSRRD